MRTENTSRKHTEITNSKCWFYCSLLVNELVKQSKSFPRENKRTFNFSSLSVMYTYTAARKAAGRRSWPNTTTHFLYVFWTKSKSIKCVLRSLKVRNKTLFDRVTKTMNYLHKLQIYTSMKKITVIATTNIFTSIMFIRCEKYLNCYLFLKNK